MPFSASPGLPKIAAAAVTLLLTSSALCQMSQQYRQAAQLWRNVSCSAPADKSCANQEADYMDCLANQLGPGGGGMRCSKPSCSTASCGSGGGSGGAESSGSSTPDIPLVNTGNAKADLVANGLGLLLKWKLSHDANKSPTSAADSANAAKPNDDAANEAAQAAQAEMARKQINDSANQLLAEASAYTIAPTPSAVPETNSAIGALFDSPAPAPDPSPSVSGQINNLLDSPAPDPNSPAGAVAALLDTPVAPTPAFTPAQLQQMVAPQGSPAITAAYQDSQDAPLPTDPAEARSLAQTLSDQLSHVKTELKDGYDKSVAAVKNQFNSVVSNINDPALNCLVAGSPDGTPPQTPDDRLWQGSVRCGALKLLGGPAGGMSWKKGMDNTGTDNATEATEAVGLSSGDN